MAYQIPTVEPTRLTAGDTAKWKISLADFPAGDGWSLQYVFVGKAGKQEATSSADGAEHLLSIAASATANWAPGEYRWHAYATQADERYKVREGALTVEANLAATAALDARTHARKVLDAIEAVLEKRATQAHMEYEIEGRRLRFIPVPELLTLRSRYRGYVRAEEDAARLAKGLPSRNQVRVRL